MLWHLAVLIHVNSDHCNAIGLNQTDLCAELTESTLMVLIANVMYVGVKMRLLVDGSAPFLSNFIEWMCGQLHISLVVKRGGRMSFYLTLSFTVMDLTISRCDPCQIGLDAL